MDEETKINQKAEEVQDQAKAGAMKKKKNVQVVVDLQEIDLSKY
jgi:hypothetical protein